MLFQARNVHKPPFSVINWTFFPRIQILNFLPKATQDDHIRAQYDFGMDKENLGVLGVVDMRQLLLKRSCLELWFGTFFELEPNWKDFRDQAAFSSIFIIDIFITVIFEILFQICFSSV